MSYPFQDIWLDDSGIGGVLVCWGGSLADHNTNAKGRPTMSADDVVNMADVALLAMHLAHSCP